MPTSLRVLLLEDSEADADLVTHRLAHAGIAAQVQRVDSRDAFIAALRDFAPQVVISDHAMAQFNALAALELLQAKSPGVPLIVLSGSFDEGMMMSLLRAGAADVIAKRNLSRLPEAIREAREARRGLEKLSPRQIQVLRLVAAGNTTPQIARELALSVKTVETHRSALMKRLEIHEVAGLVRYAMRVGLLKRES
jgi:DNA-binding NarL/FixJ family response regulator